jgi:hypothetical protein
VAPTQDEHPLQQDEADRVKPPVQSYSPNEPTESGRSDPAPYALERPFAATTIYLDGPPAGLRRIESWGSRLSLFAGPYTDASRLRAFLDSAAYVVYAIADPAPGSDQPPYFGHSDKERRWGDRLPQEIRGTTQIYILTADGGTLDKVMASYIEARFIQICTDLNIKLFNSARPYGGGLRVRAEAEQLVGHAEMLLHAAGFTCIDDARRAPATVRRKLSVTADLDEMVVMTETEAIAVPCEGERFRLSHRELKADAYRWNGSFYVLPGADYARRTRTSLSDDHRRRRELMEAEKWVGAVPGSKDKMTLQLGFRCRSGAFAAKLLSGEKLDEDAWLAADAPSNKANPGACEDPA